MTDKPGTANLTFNERLSQNHASGFNPMKSSVVVPGTKTINQGFAFSNQRPDMREMSKSYIQKQGPDLESFMRDVRSKFFKIDQSLSEHDTQLRDLRSSRDTKSFGGYSMSTSSSTDSFSMDIARNLREEWSNDFSKFKGTLYQEIDRIRAEVNSQFLRKTDMDFTLAKIQMKIIDVVRSNGYGREIAELREKISFECRSLESRVSQELNSKINTNNEQSRTKLNELEQQVSELRRRVETLKQEVKPSVFSSNQKFYSPRLVKYKEVIQKLPTSPYEKPGEEITINQIVYYLDKEGRLLDSSHNYLVDKSNREVQLDYKQLAILNAHNMLL